MRVQHEVEEIFEQIRPELRKIMELVGEETIHMKVENGVAEMALKEKLEDGEEAVHRVTLYPAVDERTEYKVNVYRRSYDDILVG